KIKIKGNIRREQGPVQIHDDLKRVLTLQLGIFQTGSHRIVLQTDQRDVFFVGSFDVHDTSIRIPIPYNPSSRFNDKTLVDHIVQGKIIQGIHDLTITGHGEIPLSINV